MEREARSIISLARDDADKTINQLRQESASEIEAIQKTTDLVERQRGAETAKAIETLRAENDEKKAIKIAVLGKLVNRERERAIKLCQDMIERLS